MLLKFFYFHVPFTILFSYTLCIPFFTVVSDYTIKLIFGISVNNIRGTFALFAHTHIKRRVHMKRKIHARQYLSGES